MTMTAQFEYSHIIDRPVEKVFHFMADQHVHNHPRWDPDIELWLESDQPIQVGTIIQRRNRRSGTPVEGTMEVVEYELNRAIGTLIHDGPVEIRGRITFEPIGSQKTLVKTSFEVPSMDEPTDKSFMLKRLERSAQNQKRLIESET
jgi:uncharacterized protein YndB with AHSA1/START domain